MYVNASGKRTLYNNKKTWAVESTCAPTPSKAVAARVTSNSATVTVFVAV